MSAIPPSVVGSVLQSPAAQTEQTRSTDAARNAQTDASQKLASTVGDVLEIEETDAADTQVHTDAEGGGSQGRHDAPPEEEQPAEEQPGVVLDDKGVPHIDLSA